MKYQNYYQLLGITRDASEKEIKQAYRRLARQYHPDVNHGADAEERFKEINEAYEVLSDSDKRQRYDVLDNNYQAWQRSGARSDFDWSSWTQSQRTAAPVDEEPAGGVFSDFFRAIFGDGGGRRTSAQQNFANKQAIPGRDKEIDVYITLEEAYTGTTRQIEHTGHAFTARIPGGAKTGTRVRFAGQGERGFAGGKPGSLFVNIQVEDHPVFDRLGDDLYMDIEVSVYKAVLGGDVRIPTPGGDVKLKIPPGTQSGRTIRLKERGMPLLREDHLYGDLFARVLIIIPDDLNDEEIDLFEQLSHLRPNF